MVELLATLYNMSRNEALQFIVTTHSPYILTAFNDLICRRFGARAGYKEGIGGPEQDCAFAMDTVPS